MREMLVRWSLLQIVALERRGEMREIREQIEIDAPPWKVWSVLIDLPRYAAWNPLAIRGEGVPMPRKRLKVRIASPEGRGMTFRPTVTSYEAGRTFRWRGRLLVPGLLDGEHIHEVEPLEGGRTRYVQRERFRGLLVPLFAGMLEQTRRGFRGMNEALKARVEDPTSESLETTARVAERAEAA